MKKYFTLLIIILVISSCSMLGSRGNVSSQILQFPETAEKVLPSVVQVTAIDLKYQKIPEGWDFSYNPFDPSPDSLENNNKEFSDEGLGAGIVVDNQNNTYYILTNKHVIGEAEKIYVKIFDGTVYAAEVKGIDERKDLAVVSFETDKKIPVIKWGNSDKLRIGEWVMAVGNPYGYNSTVTAGIISGLGRKNSTGGNISDFIQTDASINHGNSGGALVNLDGELIGINSWITTPTGGSIGLGFALPSNNAVKTVSDIIDYGEVRYGWVGLIGGEILTSEKKYFSETGRNSGIFIYQTVINDPADISGILPGDVVLSVDDINVNDVDLFTRVVGNLGSDIETVFTVLRNNTLVKITIKTSLRPKNDILSERESLYWPGVSVITLNKDNKEVFNTGKYDSGVIVANVEDKPFLDFLEPGDIITEINSMNIIDITDFYSSLNSNNKKNIIKYIRNDIEYTNNGLEP